MTQAQEAQAGEIDAAMQMEVEDNGLVYTCNGTARVRKEVHVNLFLNPNAQNRFGSFRADDYPLQTDGFAHICKVNVDVEIPADLDPLQEMLKALLKKKDEIKAEFTDKLMQIDAAMQELLALPAPTQPQAPAEVHGQSFDDITF